MDIHISTRCHNAFGTGRWSVRLRLLATLLFCLLLAGEAVAPAHATGRAVPNEHSVMRLAAQIEYWKLIGGEPRADGHALTPKEYSAFGGIGAIVCRLGEQHRTATAFLVGRFDIAVTVAHVFAQDGRWIAPGSCFYKSAGPAGQARRFGSGVQRLR
jgi:hypothetical protein